MKKQPKRIGLAILGAGRVGLLPGEVAARHPVVDSKTGADFVTRDFRKAVFNLLRPA